MKKIVVIFIVWILLEGFAFCWEKESFFPGEIFPFRHSFNRGGFFFGGSNLDISSLSPGYYPYYYPYYPREYKQKYESPYPMEIKEAGKLSIQVMPQDAEVLLNGYPISSRELGLLIGKYQIEARKEGYKKHWKEIEIKTATTINLRITLERSE
ncbi:MAG: hypothetical protein A3A94_02020 [Candidatus Portnoybacteria bacterium RIFCSPLOWO2_01_FULL_43_11]|uniref:PEGA domain-containing protein n=1 Tax=Candidatus Portnoybacteria bacterium RIFCSPLOWO2_01_FULL_43_11 TaxID=1802000 RepID=A0A1G2FL23_9BACT|nr:MAG: hypothetical protein A3A94_02020 [Candidatus Portnoybacteria bacterium RIFCSPLOWO2_01_FULL_43_11]